MFICTKAKNVPKHWQFIAARQKLRGNLVAIFSHIAFEGFYFSQAGGGAIREKSFTFSNQSNLFNTGK